MAFFCGVGCLAHSDCASNLCVNSLCVYDDAAMCGNGVIEASEECDDFGASETCTAGCEWIGDDPNCGNGVVEGDEECDVPDAADICTPACFWVNDPCGGDGECGPDAACVDGFCVALP